MQTDNLLKKNGLSITGSRKKILQLFFEQPGALAHGDIEKRAGEKFDRVTIYRTLQTFVDKGIMLTTLFAMLYARMNVRKVIIMIITFILFVKNAIIHIASMM